MREQRQVRQVAGGRAAGARGPNVGLREIQREYAAGAWRALQLDLAAQQAGELAADGKSQAGAAVLAAGAGIRLLECLEDDSLLIGGDTDAGVGDLERNDRGCTAED